MESTKKVSKITIILIVIVVVLVALFVLWKMKVFDGLFYFSDDVASNDNYIESDASLKLSKEEVRDIPGENNIQLDTNGKKINNSNVISSEYYLDEVMFNKFEITGIEGKTKITCAITNLTNDRVVIDGYYIYFYDSENNCVGRKYANGEKLGAGEEIEVDIIVEADVVNLSEISLERVYSDIK